MPGSESSCSAVATLSWTGPAGAAPPTPHGRALGGRDRRGQPRGHEHLLAVGDRRGEVDAGGSALRVGPPARATASATRDPPGSRYSPGRRTAPTT